MNPDEKVEDWKAIGISVDVLGAGSTCLHVFLDPVTCGVVSISV
jgi:hypothetical protein